MSLALRTNIDFGKDALIIYDTTCKNDSCKNTGGYGTPNEAASDATAATISITLPTGGNPYLVNVFPYLPNENGTGFKVFASSMGIEQLPVGVYAVEYSVSFPGQTYTKQCFFFNTCPVDCCLADRVKAIEPNCYNQEDAKTNKMILMVQSALDNFACCNYDRADELIKEVYELCTGHPCDVPCNC